MAERERALVTGGAGFLGSHLCERLLDEGAGQGVDSAVDDPAAVVGDGNLDVIGQTLLELGEPLPDPVDGGPCVGVGADDDNAADGLADPVPVRQPAPELRTDGDPGDIAEQQRSAPRAKTHRYGLEVA